MRRRGRWSDKFWRNDLFLVATTPQLGKCSSECHRNGGLDFLLFLVPLELPISGVLRAGVVRLQEERSSPGLTTWGRPATTWTS